MVSFFFLKKPDVDALRHNRDIRGLIQALRYDDFEVQTNAAQALGTLGSEAIKELILALKDKNKDVRLAS
jgi:HEAT repeat protein